MPQIILKKRSAHLASYTFFTRDVDQYKNTSLSQLYQPPGTPFSQNTCRYLLSSCEYCKVFKKSFFIQNTSRSKCLQVFFKIGVLKRFANFAGEHLCWRFFLKNLQAEGLQLYLKGSTKVFSCEVCEIFKNTFFCRRPPVTASVPPRAASVFLNRYFAALYDVLIIFSSRHIV